MRRLNKRRTPKTMLVSSPSPFSGCQNPNLDDQPLFLIFKIVFLGGCTPCLPEATRRTWIWATYQDRVSKIGLRWPPASACYYPRCHSKFCICENHNQALGDQLESEWAKEQVKSRDGKGRESLGGALLRCFGQQYAFLGLFTLLEECAFRIAQPLCMGETEHIFDNLSILGGERFLY